MEKLQTTCKHCGSDKVRLTDTEPLFIPEMARYDLSSNDDAQRKELYQWDEEIYATAVCDICGEIMNVQGTIKWNV